MVFGELIIPSTRALCGDDYTESLTYTKTIEWESQEFPENINVLLITDGLTIKELLKKCIILNQNPINGLKGVGVDLYDLGHNNYLCMCNITNEFTSGEVLQKILPLINKASDIYGITTTPIALYQGRDITSEETCIIRTLCTGKITDNYTKLQIPNLVTGIVANLLSYCVHTNRTSQIFIAYLDTAPLDSVSSEPLVKLLKEIGITIAQSYLLKLQAPSSNLYM